ncbi:MAG: HlyC/CorC family transporter [Kiritimatiellae bacterium]|nr:HlyC/CorC family transporter [Kiritimatiellia bacterium]MBR6587100.1 HlyC/CorC family transporter [Kiritimatiellia bacterium]
MTAAIVALSVLFVLSAFFSSAETVLFSLTGAQRARIKARDPAADVRIGRCLNDQAALFSTLLVGNTFVNFAISTLGYYLFSGWLPSGGWLAVPVMTLLLLLFGEITPKRLALKYTEEIAPLYAQMLWFWRGIFTPFNAVLRMSSRAFSPMLARERRALSDGELVSVMESAAESGEMSVADAKMVEGVLRLSELCANDEMTPRVDIVGYDVDLGEAERAAALASSKHRYLPVFRRTPDAIEGIIDVDTGKIEDALFVPETVALDDLLATFAKSGKPLAVVMDEYGGTAGIISVDDVLELIVGPGVFRNPDAEPGIVQKAQNVWEIDGKASLDEINRTLNIELEAEDADRLSGWVQFHAERIPHVGQQIEADGCRATVLRRRHRRVMSVRLEVLERDSSDSDWELIAETDEEVVRTEEDS